MQRKGLSRHITERPHKEKKMENEITALDYMIASSLYVYSCDPWCVSPMDDHYQSASSLNGQVNYKNEIFVVSHRPGRHGRGGMDMGNPASVSITRIDKT